MTTTTAMSRRYLLAAGASSLAVACGSAATPAASPAAPAGAAPGAGNREDLVRTWYGAWVKKDWATLDAMMTDDFTFCSPAPDDHISKATFKAQCWDTQAKLIGTFDMESFSDKGNEAFVKYLCHTTSGKAFRNALPLVV